MPVQASAQPAPLTPLAPPAIAGQGQITMNGLPPATPQAVYAGLVHQQRELNNQLEELKSERSNAGTWLREEHKLDAADRAGLQKRIVTVDARIEALEAQRAVVDAQVASAAAVPGAVVDPPRYVRQGPPDELIALGALFMLVAILPISIAYARRIWRRGGTNVAALPSDMSERLTQIDQAVESIALEVERIGEGQRFITRVLAEPSRVVAGDGQAQPVNAALKARATD
jgi:hypothetical protein